MRKYMKKLIVCMIALLPISCMKVDLEKTEFYSKITVNETNSSYISYKNELKAYDDKEGNIKSALNARTVINGAEMFCDLTGKLYIIKSEYNVGTVAIEQKGLSCKFEVIEEITKTHPTGNSDDVKTIIHH